MRFVVVLCIVVRVGTAVAQPPTDQRDDPAWALYHTAFEALSNDDRPRARTLVATLLRDHPQHPAADLVRRSELGDVPRQPPPIDRTEKPSRGARAELALFQTLHGMIVGGELCVMFECDEAGAVLGLILAGAGAGALISLNAPDLTSGQRALVNSGTAWGAANAVLLSIAADPDDEKTIAGVLLAGQLGGVLAGVGLTQLRPTSGQVALANSGGQWSLVLTGLTLAGLEADLDDAELAVALLVAADAGVAAGAYLAWRNPKISRAQTLLIDAGGIVGAVGGGSLGVIISGDEGDRTTPLLAAAGTVVGLGVTAYLTRNWTTDRDVPPVQAYVAPVTGARGGVAGVGFRW